MICEALVNFSGIISMHKGEQKELPENQITENLLTVGYIKKVKAKKEKTK